MCLRYLSLDCFKENISEVERNLYALQGYYSFQDYAAANWIKHIEIIIKDCSGLISDSNWEVKFDQALKEFIGAYPSIMESLSPAIESPEQSQQSLSQSQTIHEVDSPVDQCLPFQKYRFHAKLLSVWTHIRNNQRAKFDGRNSLSIPQLENVIIKLNRDVIEKLQPNTPTHNNDTIKDYYGQKLFKCSRPLCEFFYIGFLTAKDREHHTNRHDRPFPCPIEGCTQGPFGFASNKDRERHVRHYHPEHSDRPPAFVQLTRRAVEDANFPCPLPDCGKRFTRKINLKGHIRSHFGERPYACSSCGKAFTRVNDCKRHEKIHLRRGG